MNRSGLRTSSSVLETVIPSIVRLTADPIRQHNVSQENRDIITGLLAKEMKNIQELQKEIEQVQGKRKKKSLSSIHRILQSVGTKPFHQIPSLKLTEKYVEDRMWFLVDL